MTSDEKVRIIAHAVGMHFDGLLPGEDNTAAVKSLKGSSELSSQEYRHKLTKRGIEVWEPPEFGSDAPSYIIRWDEVLDVVAKGCTDGRRERYEEAHRAYIEQAETPIPDPWIPAYLLKQQGRGTDWFYELPANQAHWAANSRTIRELADAKLAIVAAGCAREPIQAALW
jgi:hypothetical protein